MPEYVTDKNSFVRGAVRERNLSYVLMVVDEFAAKKIPHSMLIQWEAGLFRKIANVHWSIVGLDVLRHPHPGVVAVGELGKVIIAGPNILKSEEIALEGAESDRIVPVRNVKVIGTKAYAVGMRRQVYVRNEHGIWAPLHGDMLSSLQSPIVYGFEAIDGFHEQEIYAVGWEGEIWNFNGGSWKQIVSPTNAILAGVCCASDGNAYACGQAGLFLRGRRDAWEPIITDSVKDDLWSIVCFKGRIYTCGFRCLFELTPEGLAPVAGAMSLADSFYSLSTDGDVMWSTGRKSILSFDGAQWVRIV